MTTGNPPRSKGRTGRPWRRIRLLVLERDRYTCQLCWQPIPRTVAYPHPLSAAVDHIVPISAGGAPLLMSNLRAAHMGCNGSRGAGLRGPIARIPTTVGTQGRTNLAWCEPHQRHCHAPHSRAW